MAKRKTSRKAKKQDQPQHELPSGFWPQVAAVTLIAVALLMVVAWFGAGGPIFEALNQFLQMSIGYAMYVVPFLFVYLGVAIFRAPDNRLPFVVEAASVVFVLLVTGFFGLYHNAAGETTGGAVGQLVNLGMLSLVSNGVAAFIYLLAIAVTVLFILRITPRMVIDWVRSLVQRDDTETESNVKVMREAARTEATVPGKLTEDFKLNAGVPMLDPKDAEDKKSTGLSSLRNSVKQDKVAEEQSALVMATDPNWQGPSIDLLEKKQSPADAGDIEHNAATIRDTLHEFNIDVKMEGANIGPKVTQYTLSPPSGVKLSRISALETNLALNLAAQSLRIEAPIPGQKAVGIEVPNKKAADVRLYGVLSSPAWKKATEPLSFAIGKDISGDPVVGKLNKMPHLLIAGQTGSGKSVMINTLLTSLLYRNSPSDMKLILVDPKQVEMAPYEDIPHLLTPVIVEPEKTISALKWAVNEMERRYKLLAEEKVRDISSYNQRIKLRGKHVSVEDEEGNMQEVTDGNMPYIVIVIDELADLMMVAARDVEALIVRLAQKARAVGIHLVLATQRPSVDVITGLIMDEEVMKITDYLRMQAPPQYNDEIVSQPVQLNGKGGVVMDFDSEGSDDMFRDAVRVVIESKKASTSLLQRRLRIGYARAARIIEEMEEQGIIGPADGARPRDVLITSLDDIDGSIDV